MYAMRVLYMNLRSSRPVVVLLAWNAGCVDKCLARQPHGRAACQITEHSLLLCLSFGSSPALRFGRFDIFLIVVIVICDNVSDRVVDGKLFRCWLL